MNMVAEIRRRETAKQIAKAMASAGISKADLARKLGKSPSAVTAWLSGNHNFTSDLLAEISAVLGTQITGVDASSSKGIVDGYGTPVKEDKLEDPAAYEYRVDTICLQPTEYKALSQKADKMGVSLTSYIELILGREAREEEKSEEKRTMAFLANCQGAWSGKEFDCIEEEIYKTRTIRKVEEL